MLAGLLAAAALAALAFALWVRVAPSDPDRWHADPLAAPRTGLPNDYRVGPPGSADIDRPVGPYALDPAALALAVDRLAMAGDGAERIAGGPDTLWTTYLHRSPLMRFPDYTSVRVEPDGEGARLAIHARARFGRSDLGKNRERVENWLEALDAMAQEAGSAAP
jgi:uncharacterized protein (DUF1499 family)